MATTTDVLVIGGGLMGCSTAYHLARQGVQVTLAERKSQPGQETTARSGAIIRAHYGVPELVTSGPGSQSPLCPLFGRSWPALRLCPIGLFRDGGRRR